MASTSTRPVATADISILTPVMTLEGPYEPWKYSLPDGGQHECNYVESISYFPDGKQMISGSRDKTIRQWDLRKGKEIERAREVYEGVRAVGVSRDGRWVVIAGDKGIKVSEVETGIVRTFHEGDRIDSIDISADSTLLAGGSYHDVRVWNLDTGKLVAGPFNFSSYYIHEALRFSEDSRKLAVIRMSYSRERHLQVRDVQTQKLDVQKSIHDAAHSISNVPIFWTTKDKSIVVAFNSESMDPDGKASKIHEYEASTLKTVGAPFNHTSRISGLALSSDCVLLVSSSYPTIKLWAFESRQLLASFHVESPRTLLLSPDSRQLAYTTWFDAKICICNIPANILANIESISKSKHPDILNSDATRRTVRRKPVIIPVRSPISHPPRPLHSSDPHTFLRSLHKLFSSSSTDSTVPLQFPATSPLPRPLINPDENSQTPAPTATQPSAINFSPTLPSRLLRLWPLQTNHASPNIIDVPLAPGKLRIATAGAPGDDDDLIRDEEYVPPPSPSPNSHPGIVNAGQHGSGRCCFCF
ncbi:YVTN repeat-like/Quino protein amine dehydrogenase [Suillus brevipes Sb2]|nr:YVTN repeat-like/Quino protein amine dehydrogenase [Suillus brevipes Sb2]